MKKYILAGLFLGIYLLTCPALAAGKPLAKPGVLGEETIYTTTPLSRYKNLVAEMEKVFDEDTRNLAEDLAEFIEKLYQ